jgi:hypothetical protein
MDSTEKRPLEDGPAPPPGGANTDLNDFLGALLLIAVSIAFAIAALRIPFETSNWVWYTSPGIFALAMAICLGGCSLFVAYRGFHGWLRNRRDIIQSIEWGERLRLWGMRRFLGSVAIILVYILLLGKVPFMIASVALILTLGTVFREGRLRDAFRSAVIASAVVVVVAYGITKIFGIMLP